MKMYDYSIDSSSVNPARIFAYIENEHYMLRKGEGEIVASKKGFSLRQPLIWNAAKLKMGPQISKDNTRVLDSSWERQAENQKSLNFLM